MSSMFIKTNAWIFEGTKEELLSTFCCLNVHKHQFYPQFKEVNNCLIFRTLMLGFQDDVTPFKASITFYSENGSEDFKFQDCVYPITKGDNHLLLGRSPSQRLFIYQVCLWKTSV